MKEVLVGIYIFYYSVRRIVKWSVNIAFQYWNREGLELNVKKGWGTWVAVNLNYIYSNYNILSYIHVWAELGCIDWS